MKVAHIKIENFRSFKNESIFLDDYSCFLGPNGAGKSTILTALNIFFRNNSSTSTNVLNLSEEDFHHKDTSKPIRITLTFEDLCDEAKQDFQHYYRQNQLSFVSQATWDDDKKCAEVKQHGFRKVMQCFVPFFEAEERKARAPEKISIYNSIKESNPQFELPEVSAATQARDALRQYEEEHPELCELVLGETQAYGWKGAELEKYIQWVYVPAVKDASTEQEESNKTALGQLLDRTIRARIDFEEQIAKLKEDIANQYKGIINSKQALLKDIGDSLQYKLRRWANQGANLNLEWYYDDQNSVKVSSPAARVFIGEGDFMGEIARLGHGLQRAFLLASSCCGNRFIS